MWKIIGHHTGPGSNEGLLNYLCNRDASRPTDYNIRQNTVSCNYLIFTNGDVYELAPPNLATRHAGVSSRQGKTNLNYSTVGIEIVSDGHNFTKAQKKSFKELVQYLHTIMGTTYEDVLRHKDISPGRKRDFGDNFWNSEYATFRDYRKAELGNTLPARPIVSISQKYKEYLIKTRALLGYRHDKASNQDTKEAIHKAAVMMYDEFGIPQP